MSPKATWIGVVVGLLTLSVVTQLIGVCLAVSDPSFAVEPDYASKAANWNDHQRQEEENARLGWSLELGVRTSETPGSRVVAVTLRDSFAEPLEGAFVQLEAFHNARAADILRGVARPVGRGSYEVELPMKLWGLWEFRVSVRRGEELFTHKVRKSVAGAVR